METKTMLMKLNELENNVGGNGVSTEQSPAEAPQSDDEANTDIEATLLEIEHEQGATLQQKLREAVSLLTQAGITSGSFDGNYAGYAIRQGQILVWLKKQVKAIRPKYKWQTWAEKNVPFLIRRVREQFMLLAKRKDCYGYCWMGKERLVRLVRATKGMDGDNPIGDFLQRNEVQPNPVEVTLDILKHVDEILDEERTERRSSKDGTLAQHIDGLLRASDRLIKKHEDLPADIRDTIGTLTSKLKELRTPATQEDVENEA